MSGWQSSPGVDLVVTADDHAELAGWQGRSSVGERRRRD